MISVKELSIVTDIVNDMEKKIKSAIKQNENTLTYGVNIGYRDNILKHVKQELDEAFYRYTIITSNDTARFEIDLKCVK